MSFLYLTKNFSKTSELLRTFHRVSRTFTHSFSETLMEFPSHSPRISLIIFHMISKLLTVFIELHVEYELKCKSTTLNFSRKISFLEIQKTLNPEYLIETLGAFYIMRRLSTKLLLKKQAVFIEFF